MCKTDEKARQLFKCNTIAQFKIMSWLMAEGISSEDLIRVELLAADKVCITNPGGQYMVLSFENGAVAIV